MTTATPGLVETLDDPRLIPYLPMIYLAWADGELSDREIGAICLLFTGAEGIDADCKKAFNRWLDPSSPPEPSELNALLARIQEHAEDLPEAEQLDVASLGREIARKARDDGRVRDAETRALTDLDAHMGPFGPEASRQLLASMPSPPTREVEPAFDVARLQSVLDGPRADIRSRMRELLARPEFAYRYGMSTPEHRELTLRWTARLAEEGIGALGVPEEYGGAGSLSDFVGAFTILGHHDLSLLTKFGVQFGLFAGAILRLGTEHHHERYLRDAATLVLPGCFAMTETAHGSNVRDIETVASYEPGTDEFVVTTLHPAAGKDYIGNAARDGRLAVVFAQLRIGDENHGVNAFLVPIRNEEGELLPGVRIEDNGEKIGLHGVDNGRIWFDDVRIPRGEMLDRFAHVDEDGAYHSSIPSKSRRFFTTIGTLVGGRVSVGAAAISAAKSALTIAVRYGNRRRQFGRAGEPERLLLDYPTHQRRLMPPLATTYAYHFAFERLIDDYASEEAEQRVVEATAAGLKAFGTWHAFQTIQACREACGGAGYMAENRFGALRADADVFQTFEGDNTVLAQLLTRSLLSDYRQEFESLNLLGTVRFLAAKAITQVREASPVTVGGGSEAQLRDREWQRDLFRWREEHLVSALAARMKKRLDSGMDTFAAFTAVQDHVFVCARVHVEHIVLDRFAEAIDEVEDDDVRRALDTLCDLYVLWHVEKDRGWFQEHGKLSTGAAKAVRTTVNELCAEARKDAAGLVDAFGIPDALLGAPIAT